MNWRGDVRLKDPGTRSRLLRNDQHSVEQLRVDFGYRSDFEFRTKEGRAACERDGLLVGNCTTLKRLRLTTLNRGSAISDDEEVVGFEIVFRGIAQNRSIEELYVDGYGPEPFKSPSPYDHDRRAPDMFLILSPLFEHNHNLRRLRLHLGFVFPEGNEQLFAAIGKCSSLTDVEFNAGKHDCEEYGGQFIAALTNSKSNLTKLSLSGCYHSWNGCSDLEHLIRNSLEELDLTGNDIDDEGAAVLGRVLGEGTTLKTLVMQPFRSEEEEEESMTVAGWTALFACLKSPDCALEELQLQSFHGDESALALAEALVGNTSLRTLGVQGAYLSHEGWCSFLTKLFQGANSALEHLDLSQGSLDEDDRLDDWGRFDGHEIAFALAKALHIPKRMALKTLNLTHCYLISSERRNRYMESWGVITSSVQDRIFNAESLSTVMASNHTVAKLLLGPPRLHPMQERLKTEHLESLLQMNDNADKAAVVGEKVRLYYNTCNPNVEDDELLLRELRSDSADLHWNKVIPFAMAWAGRGNNPTLLYRIIRRVPTLFGSGRGMPATKKRKAND